MEIKINDRVIVPAWVEGLGTDMEGVVVDIREFMDINLYTVKYTHPNPLGLMCNVVYKNQIIKVD